MTSPDSIDAVLDVHKMVTAFIFDAVDDLPAERMTEQPGTLVNHPAWTLSHLNAYAGVLLSMLDDASVPTTDDEMARFGFGTKPVPDPGAYLPKRDLMLQFKDRHDHLATVVAAKHADYFPRSAPERYQPLSPTIGHLAVTLLVAHPADHFGQLRLWRRVAGFETVG